MKSERGQSLVEFAIVVPLLLLLLFGIIDFGRIFHASLTIDHAGEKQLGLQVLGKM
ncbi:TadE/TadG family type IV pilus assembly protein [Bacillus sp. N9]